MLRILRGASSQTRALVTFVAAVLLPAIALAIAGLHTIGQERTGAEAQIARMLDDATRRAAGELRQELDWWQQGINDWPVGPIDLKSVSPRLREALTTPGAAVVVTFTPQTLTVEPPVQVLHLLSAGREVADPPLSVLRADAVSRELSGTSRRDPYRKLLEVDHGTAARPWLLQREAQLAEATGRETDASRAYRELSRLTGGLMGSLPADLVGRWGLCSMLQRSGPPDEASNATLRLYGDLVAGTWMIERTRYSFYSARAREWLAQAPAARREEVSRLATIEKNKQALTDAVEQLVKDVRAGGGSTPGRPSVSEGAIFVFWRARAAEQPVQALAVSSSYVSSSILPHAFSSAGLTEIGLSLATQDGKQVFPAADVAPRLIGEAGRVDVLVQGSSWRLEARPRNIDVMRHNLQRSQRLYIAMLLLMVLSIGFGVVTSVRTLQEQFEVARLKSDFASAVSHQFRSPLTGIRQLTEMLGAGRVPTEGRKAEYYGMILEEVDRLSAMVENVLGFARIKEGQGTRPFEEVDTTSWLCDMVDRLRRSPAMAGASIVSSIPDGLPRVEIDRDALERAIGNLIDNAIKYSPETRTAWIDAESDGKQISIHVRDKGIGIEEADRPHLFERFYRGRAKAVQAVAGTGLGLSLVHEVVSAHGGQLSVHSCPGQGSTFTICIGRVA
ncbi:MAG: HAMP domain-containing sensor histidine kinase [Acidobacteria bacterium]|nr:HAMP domain-containing sensor histidine kinase [Acidobacteriota bacterium]